MAFIEKFEINELKLALKNYYTYICFAVLCLPLLFIQTEYNTALMVALGFVFSLILVIDIKEYIIPDTTQILTFLLSIGLIYTSADANWLVSIAGLAFAVFMFGGIYFVYEKIIKRPALGFGDVKLFANVGLLLGFFGFNYFLWILTCSSVIFIIVKIFRKDKQKLIPYGPFIVVSCWLCLLFSNTLEAWYLQTMTNLMS